MATHESLVALAQRFLGRRRRKVGALEHRRRVRRDRHDKGRPAGSLLLPGLVRRRSSGCGRSSCRRCRRRRRGLQEQDVKLLDARRGQLQGTAAGKLQDVFELKVLVGDELALHRRGLLGLLHERWRL